MSASRCCLSPCPLAIAIAIAALLPFAPAFAQDTTGEARQDAVTLDAVQVTAQRRVENVRDVPVSVTAIDGEKLNVLASGGEDVRFLSGRVPSLNIESSFGRAFPRFYIRGLGNTDFDLNASQPVSLIYDDVVQENPILKGFPVFDLDQIEVLRGPQGTLFGRNTPAGVVKFESRKPSQETDGYAQVSYGSHDSLNVEGAIGGALSPNWSARAAVLYQKRDDWVDNTHAPGPEDKLEGYEEMAARLQLLYENQNGFSALFNVHARDLGGTARLFRANLFRKGSNDFADHYQRDQVAIDGSNFQKLESQGASARLSWDLGRTTLYSITGYESVDTLSRGDIDGGFGAAFLGPGNSGPGVIPFAAESADGLPDHSQFSQEFRVESNEWGRFDWQAGLFYFDEDITVDSFNYDSLAGGVQNGHAQQAQRNKAWAVFASGEYDVGEAFKLRGGLRYTQDKKNFSASVLQAAPFGTPVSGPFPVKTDANDVSWDLSGTYALNPDVNLYARVAKGFRAPSIQARLLFSPMPSIADSEEVVSYEAGIKADLWNKRARMGFSVFRYDVKDQQLVAVGGANNSAILLNADKSLGQGFEFDMEAYLTPDLLVTLGSSYNDTEIDDDALAVAVCGATFFAPAHCTVTDPTAVTPNGTTVAFIDGNPLPQAPKWIHNLTARWGVPVGDGEFFVYTDWAYRGEINFFLYEAREFTGKPLVEGGLRVGYNWEAGNYELALFGRNILDEERAVGGIDFNNLVGFINEPRTWGLEFTARF
ncbi:iron complex outermembrane receptor protein [Luteimonas cucumeris]|uniref:Iron complex outermembrane receptor protein n=1 Tax=Luteimonas cucumeris TaxID=985012 RepID=A0A562KVL6_9GAMM|nr:TonB-dependent receptor [Luteimonas cucumeris]TWH99460.1 iron complex outermembrane receptor protein [Luteimonas cucumeris]